MVSRIIPTLPLALFAMVAACGTGTYEDTDAVQTSVDQEFGGLTADDEAPMFGEEETYAELDEADEDPALSSDDPIEDEVAGDASDAENEARNGNVSEANRPLVFGMVMTWGHQHVDRDAQRIVVWNPTITTDCGVLAVRRLIRMERGEGVVRPRTAANTVSLRTATRPHFDGVALALAIRQGDRACAAQGMLRIETLQRTLEIPIASLNDLTLRIGLPEDNNFVLLAHRIEPDNGCRKGHLVGRWVRALDGAGNPTGNGGFYGRVIGEFGGLRGHIRGVYGVPQRGDHAGQQVFFGKYINRDGQFAGIMAGRYGNGDFRGGWHLRPAAGALHGVLGGHYVIAPERTPRGGLFRGRYASMQCLDRPATQDTLAE